MYIVVREQEKTYIGAPYQNHGREMPFASQVRITTRVTPEIDDPGSANLFWVNVSGNPFQFHVTARDLAGQDVNFLAPLIFVSLSQTDLNPVITAYTADADTRRCAARGQKVAYADPTAGDTVLKTGAFYFTAQLTGESVPYTEAPFIPVLDSAAVTIPSLSEILGHAGRGADRALRARTWQPGSTRTPGSSPRSPPTSRPWRSARTSRAGSPSRTSRSPPCPRARGWCPGSPSDAAQGNIDPGKYFGASRRQALRDHPARQPHPGRPADAAGQRGAERPDDPHRGQAEPQAPDGARTPS